MANVQNIKIGACKVLFNGIDLGHTKGGVTLSYERELSKISADQWGESAVDYSLNGQVWRATVRLTETQIPNLAKAFPEGTLAGAGNGRFTLGSNAGLRFSDYAHQLVLHPIYNDPTDASEDVVFHKAVPVDNVEVEYNNEDQRVIEVIFEALVDTTKADGNWLGFIGDSTD